MRQIQPKNTYTQSTNGMQYYMGNSRNRKADYLSVRNISPNTDEAGLDHPPQPPLGTEAPPPDPDFSSSKSSLLFSLRCSFLPITPLPLVPSMMEVVGLGEATPRVLEADEAEEEAAWLLAALVFRRKNPVVGSSNLTSRQWFSAIKKHKSKLANMWQVRTVKLMVY